MYDDIQYDTDDGIVTITIDRPEVYNAFTKETIRELNDALRKADNDDGIYIIILTGADNGFCSGADITSMPDWDDLTKEEYAGYLRAVQNIVRQLRATPKPSIAAVNGPAIGAGCDFALACDVRFVSPEAILREGFVRVGLIPGDGGGWLLPRLIGESKATEYLLTGKDITADEAVDLGLAVRVIDDSVDAAHEFGEKLLNRPATAIRRTKRLIDSKRSFEEYCERAIEYQWECINDPEHKEAITAFQENRNPEYERD